MPALNGLGNVLLTNDIIAKQALRLLKNNLVYGRIASKRYQDEFGMVGNTINVELAPRVLSTEGRVIGIKPIVRRTTPLTIDRQRNVGLEFTAQDRTLSLGEFTKKFLQSAVTSIANAVDLSIAEAVYQQGFYQSGTAGTAISEDSIIDAMADAELVGMPRDGRVAVVLDPRDRAAIAKSLKSKYNPQMVEQAIRKGYIGDIDDVATYSSANARTHLTGTHTSGGLVNAVSVTPGATSIVTDDWAANTVVLKKGDVISFDSVYSVNPQNYDSTGQLMQFTVLSDVTSDGSGNATITFSPAMNDGTQTIVDGGGSTITLDAYKNVSAMPANNAAITVGGNSATRYRIAPLFHEEAIAFAAPPLRPMPEFPVSETMTDPDTGISISLLGGGDITNHTAIYRLDVIWGVKAVQPELIRRIIGAAVS